MSQNQITHDLYRWLLHYRILPNTLKYKSSGNFELDHKIQQQMQCGYLISILLLELARQNHITLNQSLISSVKNSNTPASRVYNWNILAQAFTKLGVALPKQQQKQISSGNFNTLVQFILEVQAKTSSKKLQQNPIPSKQKQQGIDIKKIHKYQQIDQSESVLEIVLILICKHMNLNTKQAIATLTESAKYLAHMTVKGIKSSFEEIIKFLQQMHSKMGKIMYLVEKDSEHNIQFLLQIIKPTLISRDTDVAKEGTLVLKALIYEAHKYNSKNIIYQILCRENQGFDFIYMGYKRHPYLNFQMHEFMRLLFKGVWRQFVEVQLKKSINNEQQLLKTCILMLEPILANKEDKQEVQREGLMASWQKGYDLMLANKLKGKDIINYTQETKYQYTQLMYTLFMGYYGQLEPQHTQELLIKITQQLKRNTRSEVYTVRIPSLLKLFNLLDFLASNKNKLAALLYKKIIFLFVENHDQNQMRQIVLQNLTIIICKFPTIPLEFLLDPLVKQLTNKQGTSYILNMYDFQLIIELCRHPKMEQYYAIILLDYFIKLYTKSVIYSALIFRAIEAITARFCQSEQIREYCLKSTETSLNNYGMLVMGKSRGKPSVQANPNKNKQQVIINNQKKSLIIELIKHYVSLQHKQMTQEIKEKVTQLFVDWYQNKNHYDKGLASVLMEIGDIEEIVIDYKQKQMEENNHNDKHTQSNKNSQFYNQNQVLSRLDHSKLQSKQLSKFERQYGVSERASPNLQEIGLGYKKKRNLPNKYEVLPSRSKNIRPDPKVLEDIEKIKEKWKLDQSRAKLEQVEAKKDKTYKLNQKQLLQRNISLGYAKLPDLNGNQILFDFDSVKKTHLKDSLSLVDLQAQQQRQQMSFINIIQRYQKHLKSLFTIYSNKSQSVRDQKEKKILSFTQVMRMLKDKNLLAKIPKIAINQIISAINQKRKKQRNILGGIYQSDFPTFILHFTDLLMQQDATNKKDQPFGMKAEKVILRLIEGEQNTKELFDPKIQKLKEDLQYNQNIQIPQDFKKYKQMQIDLDYTIRNPTSSISQSFISCYQIIDGLVYQAVGVHIISPFSQLKQKINLVRVFKQSVKKSSQSVDKKLVRSGTQEIQNSKDNEKKMLSKDIMADSQNSFTKPLKKLSKNLLKPKSQSQKNIAGEDPSKNEQALERDKKRQQHARKLKQQILKLRQQKQKHLIEQKQKQKIQQEKKKKKQELRQQYLQENKRKLKQKKQEQQKKEAQSKKAEEQKKEKRKAEVKAKQVEMVEKQKKLIQQKKLKLADRIKQKQFQQQQKDKFNKSKSPKKLLDQMKTSSAGQKMQELQIKNSMQNGQIKQLVDKNKKNFQDLFHLYCSWQNQKMQLKNLAQMFKDFETAKYISPKQIADVYKSTAKGKTIGIDHFIECVVKLSYRYSSDHMEQPQKAKGDEYKISVSQFQFMLKLLKMNETNYKQTIQRLKKQKQQK